MSNYETISNIDSLNNKIDRLYTNCSGYYDNKSKKYISNNPIDVFKCCINNCSDYLSYCKRVCDSEENCDKCYRYFEDCQEGCESGDFWTNNYFNKCTQDSSCFNNYVNDLDCIKRNKNDLIDCCLKSCDSIKYENCSDYCNYMYDFTVNDVDNKNLVKWQSIQSKKNTVINNISSESLEKSFLNFIMSLFFVFVAVFLYFRCL